MFDPVQGTGRKNRVHRAGSGAPRDQISSLITTSKRTAAPEDQGTHLSHQGSITHLLDRAGFETMLKRFKSHKDLSTLTEGGKTIPVGALTTQFMYASDRIKGQQYKSEFSSDRPSSLLEHVVHVLFAGFIGMCASLCGATFHYLQQYIFEANNTLLPDLIRPHLGVSDVNWRVLRCVHMTLTATLSALLVGYITNRWIPEW
jgi:hypothetical protein